MDDLFSLYTTIVKISFRQILKQEVQGTISVMGTMIYAKQPLNDDMLVMLSGVKIGKSNAMLLILKGLVSIIGSGNICKGTPSPQLQSDPVADPILLHNIGSYSHHSESTPLPPNILSLFRPWLPMQGHEDTIVYNVDYSLQEPHLIL